jgi:predicted transcriptional regulator
MLITQVIMEDLMPEDWVQTSLRMPKELLKTLKQIALDTDRSLQDVVVEALQDYARKKAK